ncbi:MAG: alpha/beta hydrolase [Dehalococcoidia bacterium]|nr:alpha/beta hydrolase [Dehalococcoidia bacterium]
MNSHMIRKTDLPERSSSEKHQEFSVQGDGVELFGYHWEGKNPPLVFVHGTSFHARCWDQVVRYLPGYEVFSFDLRGHGRAETPIADNLHGIYTGSNIALDLRMALENLNITDAMGIGHSMGGHVVVSVQSENTDLFSSLLLIDPVMSVKEVSKQQNEMFNFVRKRRNEWSSPEEMIDRFSQRFPHSQWEPKVLEDYVRYGLLPNASNDGFQLACPPLVEAAIYESGDSDLRDEASLVQIPVHIIRAKLRDLSNLDEIFGFSPTDPEVVDWFSNATELYLPDANHFLPMEHPSFVADQIMKFHDRVYV